MPDDPDSNTTATPSALDFVQRAIVLLAQGDAHGALTAASEACHGDPGLPGAHYAYGQAWTALGDHQHAEQAFAAAIQLSPTWADAWVNYGVARYRQGAIDDAIIAMRQALRHAPSHAAAVANLGAFLRISGDRDEAEMLLRDHLAREPASFGTRLNLAADLLLEERAAEALPLLEGIGPLEDLSAFRHWRLQQALALLQLGRLTEARAALDTLTARGPLPPSLKPLLHWRWVLLALAEGDPARARREAEQMEAALAWMGEAVPEHAIMARFDLAKFWSGQDAPDRAFGHWIAGHALLKRGQPFSRDGHRAFVDASIAAFRQHRLHAGPRAHDNDPAPIFIVGMPRSGTTLVEQILAAHHDVHAAGERSALGRAFTALGGLHGDPASLRRIAALDSDTLDQAGAEYRAALHALAPDKARVVDKLPSNFLYLGLVALLLPGAKIIHCVRDPRDVGLSIFTFRFHGMHAYAHDLGDLGWYIGEHDRLMAHWRAAVPNPILTIRLADWVGNFDTTLARVLTHLDLPADPNCARFHEIERGVHTVSRAQVRQPVNARGLGRWRAYARHLAPLIVELDAAGSLDAWNVPG